MKTRRLTTRFLGGRALRLQPDGRLVALVRDGYEAAFEEIFRRYGAALRSYAASIVTVQRAEDVTQEAFTKAYLALRGTEKEIQLRPWLYRIVRNTALTNIRDEPKLGLELADFHPAGLGPEELAEHREEIKRLLDGLQKLPEPQRAAIVMRELEGLSHEQIAASLGLSGGAVRQSIYRARRALRDGIGLLLPLPVLRMLLEEGFTQGASAAAAGGGAGIAVKTGVAALLAAGTVTTGAVIKEELKTTTPNAEAKSTKTSKGAGRGPQSVVTIAQANALGGSALRSGADSGPGEPGHGSGDDASRHPSDNEHSGRGSGGPDPEPEDSHSRSGDSEPDDPPSSSSGPGPGSESTGSGPGSGSESSGSGSSGHGGESDDLAPEPPDD